MKSKVFRFRYSIRKKIVLIICLLLICAISSIGLISYTIAKRQLEDQGKVILQNSVNMILMLIDAKNAEVEAGAITLEEAQEDVKTYILGKAEMTGESIEVVSNQAGDKKTIDQIKRPINKDIYLGENGYPIIYSQDGMEIAHPSLEGTNIWNIQEKGTKNGKYLAQEQIQAAMQEDGGYVTYYWTYPNSEKIGEKITYQKMDPNWNWIVIAGTYMSDFNKGANVILRYVMIGAILSIAIGSIIAFIAMNKIVGPILLMADTANELSAGDFRRRDINIKNVDEIGKMADALVQLRDNVSNMLQAIYESANRLSSSSEELTASAEQSAQASGQVAYAVSEVAMAAERQLQLAEDAEQEVMQISESMNLVLDNAKMASHSAEKTAATAGEGGMAIEKVVTQMKVIAEKTNQTADVINDLEERSNQIGEIVTVISNIAEQTNLLALNAAIEAARAGESGRGFSVVAEEVRKLAEQSQGAANKITTLISEIQVKMESAVTFMGDGKKEVEEGANVVSDAGRSFEDILRMIQTVTDKIQEIHGEVEVVTKQTDTVVNVVLNMNDESKKTVGESQTISAATEQQSASSEEIAAASENLSQMATELQEALSQFQIE